MSRGWFLSETVFNKINHLHYRLLVQKGISYLDTVEVCSSSLHRPTIILITCGQFSVPSPRIRSPVTTAALSHNDGREVCNEHRNPQDRKSTRLNSSHLG